MRERRHHKRISVEGVQCDITLAASVEIVNMSIGGAELIAGGRLDINKEYILRIEEGGRIFPIKGTIIWSVLSGSRKTPDGDVTPVYRAGMRFSDVLSSKMAEVHDFIEHHKKSPEQRVIARFKIAPPEKTLLDYPLHFRVRKVSLGGVLLDAERAFTVEETFPMELVLNGDRKISFTGRIASCLEGRDKDPKRYSIGVEFLEMAKDSKRVLEEFIGSL